MLDFFYKLIIKNAETVLISINQYCRIFFSENAKRHTIAQALKVQATMKQVSSNRIKRANVRNHTITSTSKISVCKKKNNNNTSFTLVIS